LPAVRRHHEDAVEVDLARPYRPPALRGPPIGGIGEVDSAVAPGDDVVRAIQLLALPVRGDRRDPAVVVGARNSARHVLAGNEPALRVIRQPVRLAARPTPDADTAGVPAADDVTGNV